MVKGVFLIRDNYSAIEFLVLDYPTRSFHPGTVWYAHSCTMCRINYLVACLVTSIVLKSNFGPL